MQKGPRTAEEIVVGAVEVLVKAAVGGPRVWRKFISPELAEPAVLEPPWSNSIPVAAMFS